MNNDPDPYRPDASSYGDPAAGYGPYGEAPYQDTTGGHAGHSAHGGYDGYGGYGPAGYGPPAYGPAVPMAPYAPPKAEHEGSATLALVLSCVQLVLCCGLTAIPGIVLGALALGEKLDLERGARLTRNAWISVWVNLGIIGLVILGYVGIIFYAVVSSP
ncbi:hypothetical protein PWG71_05160 [Nocardiopsis sp. N85]|uniref:hypothetical protein n=1 Tax=Nocardiopsis sp. N85 TaxID=3029400 RepID=UPI00237F963B|nr:hypothetical protein [Nocardiopsis sp. N85]MDE3720767.1 hypothetical protein [Nocardiopsis sp. N85]